MSLFKEFTKGFVKENPLFVLVLGTCPSLAITTSASNAIGMGAAVIFVLTMSNIFISLLKKFIPDKVRIPAFIVIIATFVTIVDLVMHAFTPDLYSSLGVFIPLIVVNCIILGRAEAFAQKNTVLSSTLDGLGMGIGYTLVIFAIASIREILGNGSFFNMKFVSPEASTILIFIMPPGAFLTFGYLMVVINKLKAKFN